MTKKQLILIIGFIFILAQISFFCIYLPCSTNKIIIDGQRCTCPHAKVKSGEVYLKSITPDSLLKFNLDYSELFFINEISTNSDPLGVEKYIITGHIVGKKSISEGDRHYYPLFKIDNFYDAILYNIIKWIILGSILFEFIILYAMVKRKKNNT